MVEFESIVNMGKAGPDYYDEFEVKNGKYASHGLVTNVHSSLVGSVDDVLDIKHISNGSVCYLAMKDGFIRRVGTEFPSENALWNLTGLDYIYDSVDGNHNPGEVRNGYASWDKSDTFMGVESIVRYGQPSTRKPVSAFWAQQDRHRHVFVSQSDIKPNGTTYESDQAIVGSTDTFPTDTDYIAAFRRKSDQKWFLFGNPQFGNTANILFLPSEFDGKDRSEIFSHQNRWCTNVGGSNYLLWKPGEQDIVTLNSPLTNIVGVTNFDTRDDDGLQICGISGSGRWSKYTINYDGVLVGDEKVFYAPTDIESIGTHNNFTNSFSKPLVSFTSGDNTYSIGLNEGNHLFGYNAVANTSGYLTTGAGKAWVKKDTMAVYATNDNPNYFPTGNPPPSWEEGLVQSVGYHSVGSEAYSGKYAPIHTISNHDNWKVVPIYSAFRYEAAEDQLFFILDGSTCFIYSIRVGFKRDESDWTIEPDGELCVISGYEFNYRVSGEDAGVVNRFYNEFWNSADNDGISIDDMGRMFRAPEWNGFASYDSYLPVGFGRIQRDAFPAPRPKLLSGYNTHWGASGRLGAVEVYTPDTGHRGFYQDGYYYHGTWYADHSQEIDKFDPDSLYLLDTFDLSYEYQGYGFVKFDKHGEVHDIWFADRALADQYGIDLADAESILYDALGENYGSGAGVFHRKNKTKAIWVNYWDGNGERVWIIDPVSKSIELLPELKTRQFTYEPDSKFLPQKPSSSSIYVTQSGSNFPPITANVNEEFYLETRSHSTSGSGVSTAATIPVGDVVTVTVHGNWNNWGYTSSYNGSPDAQIYPSPSGNASVNAIRDAETLYAYPAVEGNPSMPQHYQGIYVNTGSGWFHPTPAGGHPTAPNPSHSYTYTITGAGQPIRFAISDTPLFDNHGRYKITVTGTINPNAEEAYNLWSIKDLIEHPSKDGHIIASTQDFNILEYDRNAGGFPTTIYIDRISQEITGEEYIATMCPHPSKKNIIAYTMADYNVRMIDLDTGEFTAVENAQFVDHYPGQQSPFGGVFSHGAMQEARYRYMFDYGQMMPLENPCKPENSQRVESIKVDFDYGDDLPIDWWRW